MISRYSFFVLFFVLVYTSLKAQERSQDKDIKINIDALKALNLGSPRKSSDSYNSIQPIGVKELTNEILGKKDKAVGRIKLGISCFASFYKNAKHGGMLSVDPMGFGLELPPRGGMVLSKAAMAPIYRAGDMFSQLYGPSQNTAFSFGLEKMLESLFRKSPPKLWLSYADLSKTNINVETEMPDSLVRIREATASMVDSLITTSHKKYKIVYLLCEESDLTKTSFSELAKYVADRPKEFDLFPVSEKGKNDVSCIAKYLKKNAYFSPVYVMSGKHKEKLILMLDKSSQAISLMACDENIAKNIEKLKRLP